jgi:hypothetical protein
MPKVDSCGQGHDFQVWRGREVCMDCGYTEFPGKKEAPDYTDIEGYPV